MLCSFKRKKKKKARDVYMLVSKATADDLQLKTPERTGFCHQVLLNPQKLRGLLKDLMTWASPPDGAVLDKNTTNFTAL